MKFTKLLMAGAITLGLSSSILSPVNAATATEDEVTIYGGWSEDTGYFTNFVQESGISLFAATSTASHSATKEHKKSGSALYERVIANTTWKGEYHYSRARYEGAIFNTIEADSGRVWGNDVTKAVSGWHPGDLDSVAKTYYGK